MALPGGGGVLHTLLGVVGNVVTTGFFLVSSIQRIYEMLRKRSLQSEPRSCNLYLFMLFNCMLWTFYGLPFNRPHNFWVLLTNSIGCAFSLATIVAYLCYASKRTKVIILWELHIFLFLFLIMVVMLLFVNKSHERRVVVIGSISAVFSSFMHLMLLSELAVAWKNYDIRLLHPLSSVLAFLKGALWTSYGWNSRDWFILIPNAIGVAIGIVQLAVSVTIRCNLHRSGRKSSASADDARSTVSMSSASTTDPLYDYNSGYEVKPYSKYPIGI